MEDNPRYPYLTANVVFCAGVAQNGQRMEFAAIVNGVIDAHAGVVSLALLTGDGIAFPKQAFEYSALPQPGTWHWPDKSAPVMVANFAPRGVAMGG